ncbi:MAG TPA: methyltransferase domain-containing protein [Gammaproteobacteria bacterium]|nr:methyltransferase domain-containing protein [Gammaproteobacteria bacterium]
MKDHFAMWFDSPAGRQMLDEEAALLAEVYATLFGYWIIQVGAWGHATELLDASKIRGRVLVAGADEGSAAVGMTSEPHALAIAPDSVDAVLLPHTLERSSTPHAVLREAERVLVGEGRVLILGFNPWSLWGGRRRVAKPARSVRLPWATGQYIGEWRMKDWLSLLGFEVIHSRRYLHGLPSEHPALLRRVEFTRTLGRRCWPRLAGGYFIVARKRVTTLTPIKPLLRARRKRRLVGGLVEPAPGSLPRSS